MATLLNLLKGDDISVGSGNFIDNRTNTLYTAGVGSKGLDYPEDSKPLLGSLVSFSADENGEPTFNYNQEYTRGNTIDTFIRGGTSYAVDRRKSDLKRISNFLGTSQGAQFLTKQVTLQLANPRKPKIYNLGINTLQSVALAGVSNVKRGGILSLGGLDVMDELGISPQDYLDDIGGPLKKHLKENKFSLGDPGKETAKEAVQDFWKSLNPFKRKTSKPSNVYYQKIDKINAMPVLRRDITTTKSIYDKYKDFINFSFEVIDHDNRGNNLITFRAFLDSLSDDFTANHNTFKYNGRGEEFYTYNKFNRKIQVSFKIAAQSRFEMKPLYQKINYLAAQTAPNYSSKGRIRTPYCFLTVGDWIGKVPGVITNVGLNWQKDYTWEIRRDENQTSVTGNQILDKDLLQLPHVLDVSVSFQPIHSFTPSNNILNPFIGIDGKAGSNRPNWLANPTDESLALEGTIVNNGADVEDIFGDKMSAAENMMEGENPSWEEVKEQKVSKFKSKANATLGKIGDFFKKDDITTG